MGLKKWLNYARSVSLMQSSMPALLAVVLAIGQPGFNLWLAILAVVGVMCAHLGMNLADDYFDYRADMLSDRDKVIRRGFRAMTEKYPYLTDGSVTSGGLLSAIFSFGGVAAFCGALIFLVRNVRQLVDCGSRCAHRISRVVLFRTAAQTGLQRFGRTCHRGDFRTSSDDGGILLGLRGGYDGSCAGFGACRTACAEYIVYA